MISRVETAMTANLLVLRTLVPLAPLLGLIGTVSGMLEVFDSMALRGSADARAMASGVSEAMICTLSGLAVSITGLYPIYYFQSRTRLETELLADKLVVLRCACAGTSITTTPPASTWRRCSTSSSTC